MAQENHLQQQHHIKRRPPASAFVYLRADLFKRQPKPFPVHDLVKLQEGIIQTVNLE